MSTQNTFDASKIEHDSLRQNTILTNIYNAKLQNFTKEQFMMINKDPKVKRDILVYWDNVAV